MLARQLDLRWMTAKPSRELNTDSGFLEAETKDEKSVLECKNFLPDQQVRPGGERVPRYPWNL